MAYIYTHMYHNKQTSDIALLKPEGKLLQTHKQELIKEPHFGKKKKVKTLQRCHWYVRINTHIHTHTQTHTYTLTHSLTHTFVHQTLN